MGQNAVKCMKSFFFFFFPEMIGGGIHPGTLRLCNKESISFSL